MGVKGIDVREHGHWEHHPAPEKFIDEAGGFAAQGGKFLAYKIAEKSLFTSADGGATWRSVKLPREGTSFRAVAVTERHGETADGSYQSMRRDGQTLVGLAQTRDRVENRP